MAVGRNDPCVCGSGKKYKHCCLARQSSAGAGHAPQADIGRLLSSAWQCLQAGDLASAENLCAQALALKPREADVLHLSGLIAAQSGRSDQAIALLNRACAAAPAQPAYHINLGNVHMQRAEYAQAEASFRKAAAIDTGSADIQNNLGYALLAQGKQSEAAASFRRAVKLAPDNLPARLNLFNLLHDLKDWAGARDQAEALVQRHPQQALAHYSLGLLHHATGELAAAEAAYRKALALMPQLAAAHSSLGDVLMATQRLPEAEQSYRAALRIDPALIATENNLGLALHNQGRLSEAAACFEALARRHPNSSNIHVNAGNVQKDAGDVDAALASYRKALSIEPDNADAWGNLLFVLNYLDGADSDMVYAEHKRWGERAEAAVPALPAAPRDATGRRLRIGYVSGDLKQHPVAYFLEDVLMHHDRSRVESYCYAFNANADNVTERLRGHADHWRSIVSTSDVDAAEAVRRDGIDILIDLSGHTAGNRLDVFARKPAPVQVTWLGYANTTGLSRMDYLITDPVSSPADDRQRFSEKLLRMPQVRMCYRAPDYLPEVAPLPAAAKGHITFGCFNNINKLNPRVLGLWARILAGLPNAVLRLKSKYFADSATCERLRAFFATQGVHAERLQLSQQSEHRRMLEEYAEVDIALDPFPYTGGTTTCEALWCGVPVLTLRGDSIYARQSASFLRAANLKDWIAENEVDYLDKALSFAARPDELATLRSGLRGKMQASPAADAAAFTKSLEDLLWSIAK